MATLTIKGHPTKGKEVIQLLEMLGGNNIYNHDGTSNECYTFANDEICAICTSVAKKNNNYVIFTLEEFERKFPYKVGDCVSSKYLKNYKIEKAEWDSRNNKVIYKLQGMGWYSTEELQPYKEENKETISIDDFKANTKEWLIDKLHGMIISDAVKTIGDIYEELHKPQYPKTYIECAKILDCFSAEYIDGYKNELLEKLQQLLICRDAYWKIAGDWKYNVNKTEEYFYIVNKCDSVVKEHYMNFNHILAFPIAEMRDVFYENFKDLIEQCKELL